MSKIHEKTTNLESADSELNMVAHTFRSPLPSTSSGLSVDETLFLQFFKFFTHVANKEHQNFL